MWTVQNMPSQKGKTIFITGANSGLGYQATLALATRGATVIMACRNMDKAELAMRTILEAVPDADLRLELLDLADQASIHACSERIHDQYAHLDVLINNAGVMALPKRQETKDGFEMQFGVNHLGHFSLTGLLLDKLQAAPQARIVSMSSFAHRMGRINFDDLNTEKRYNKWRVYGATKLANLLFTFELQRMLAAKKSTVCALAAHPGYSATELQRHSGLFSWMNTWVAQSAAMGALPILYAATDQAAQGGEFYGPDRWMHTRGYPVLERASKAAYDAESAQRLWVVSQDLTGVTYTL